MGVAGQDTCAAVEVVQGPDHVPVAVADLEKAAARYRALGFTLKPGRPHANGIVNRHAKFADGTEIELITAPRAVDPLTTRYREHLAGGEGPAFLCLFAPSAAELQGALDRAGLAFTTGSGRVSLSPERSLDYVFFGSLNRSPTDRPRHFVHGNTAESLVSVWLAGHDLTPERRLLSALGARLGDEVVHVPEPARATVARFPLGTVVLLPGRHQVVKGRRIVGLTVSVRDRDEAARVLGTAAVRPARPSAEAARSVFVAPDTALGYWLEFR